MTHTVAAGFSFPAGGATTSTCARPMVMTQGLCVAVVGLICCETDGTRRWMCQGICDRSQGLAPFPGSGLVVFAGRLHSRRRLSTPGAGSDGCHDPSSPPLSASSSFYFDTTPLGSWFGWCCLFACTRATSVDASADMFDAIIVAATMGGSLSVCHDTRLFGPGTRPFSFLARRTRHAPLAGQPWRTVGAARPERHQPTGGKSKTHGWWRGRRSRKIPCLLGLIVVGVARRGHWRRQRVAGDRVHRLSATPNGLPSWPARRI